MRDVTLAILAGGEGKRMGFPKQNLRIGERSILDFLLDRFAWEGPTMLVSAPAQHGQQASPQQASGRFDQYVCDPVLGLGPLRGVLTALEKSRTELVLIATVDMPGLSHAQLVWIARQMGDMPDVAGLMLSRESRIEPFPSVFRRSAIPTIQRHLAEGRRAMQALLICDGIAALSLPSDWPVETWTNLNAPVDLEYFLSQNRKL